MSCDGNTSGCPTWHVEQYGLLGNNIVRITTLYELRGCTGYEVVQVTKLYRLQELVQPNATKQNV